MVRIEVFCIVFFLNVWVNLSAQKVTSDTIVIDEVVVRNTRLTDFTTGSHTVFTDSIILAQYPAQSLADVLLKQTTVSVKTYGPNGLAGISLRGGSSRHTAVLWNGFNLQNPMNAILNFSTLPVSFIDNMAVQYGGSGSLFGSGATTGSIHLNNTLLFNQGLQYKIGFVAASFQTFAPSFNLHYSNNKFASTTRIYYQSGKNNFKFSENTDTMEHAAYNELGLMQQNRVQLTSKALLSCDIWFQNFYKEIPSLSSDTKPGNTSQTDNNLRVAINYQYKISSIDFQIRTGLFTDHILYKNPLIANGFSNNLSNQIINEAELKYSGPQGLLVNGGLSYIYETARVDDYVDDPKRQRASIFLAGQQSFMNERIKTLVTMRQEWVEQAVPFVYSFGIDFDVLSFIKLKGCASKTYSLPTFNDLFWKYDGYAIGNPDLRPESGYSAETGVLFQLKNKEFEISQEITFFSMMNRDWIVWMPIRHEQGMLYQPVNFNQGKSKGIELNGMFIFNAPALKHSIVYSYAFTKAELNQPDAGTDKYVWCEMFYVPRHKGNITYGIGWRNFNFTSNLSYTGQQKTDELYYLHSYLILDFSAGKKILFSHQILNVFIKVNNATNHSYETMAGYPMPPINFMGGFTLQFN